MQTFTNTRSTETFYIDSRGFLYLKFYSTNNYSLLTADQLNEYLDPISNICNKNVTSILVDLSGILGLISIDCDCYKLLAKNIKLKTVCKKMAFITNAIPLRLKIDKYIKVYRPQMHTRVFNYLDAGIEFCTNPEI
jgi:hypothetical protein